jgi:hypothetical protein
VNFPKNARVMHSRHPLCTPHAQLSGGHVGTEKGSQWELLLERDPQDTGFRETPLEEVSNCLQTIPCPCEPAGVRPEDAIPDLSIRDQERW